MSESAIPLSNKRAVYIEKSCNPPHVHKAYLNQFESDFTSFLKHRSEELKPDGRMILTIMGNDKHHPHLLEPIGMAINDMVSEGLIEESKLESFNFPVYSPCAEEVKRVIEGEGSFDIHEFETFHISWLAGLEDGENDNYKSLHSDKYEKGKYVGKHIRAVLQSVLANHFGNEIMDDLLHRFSIKVSELLEMGLGAYTVLLVSLIKK